MNSDALDKVSTAIKERLEALNGLTVAIAPPDRETANGSSKLILYPYRVTANASLRNGERVLPLPHKRRSRDPDPKPEDGPVVYDSALPLDVFYLLTITSPTDAKGHLFLGQAIQELQAHPYFIGEAVDGDTVRLSLEPTSTEEMSRIWALFPNATFRTSVTYLASPVWMDPLDITVAAAVVDDRRLVAHRTG